MCQISLIGQAAYDAESAGCVSADDLADWSQLYHPHLQQLVCMPVNLTHVPAMYLQRHQEHYLQHQSGCCLLHGPGPQVAALHRQQYHQQVSGPHLMDRDSGHSASQMGCSSAQLLAMHLLPDLEDYLPSLLMLLAGHCQIPLELCAAA